MNTFRNLAIVTLVSSLATHVHLAEAQTTPTAFTCIAGLPMIGHCPDGSTPLRSYTSSGPTYVSAAGFYQAGDGGGGDFYKVGSTAGTPTACVSYSSTANFTLGSNSVTLSSTLPSGITVGEAVISSATVPGAEIASIATSRLSFSMTLGATDTTNALFTVAGDNGGTLILDSVSGNQDCYQKSNFRGDPREFGAFGDAVPGNTTPHDDTTALENWLGAYGNVSATLPSSIAPANFGPWIGATPGSYLVSSPLSCPPNATIQGPSNVGNPVFQIIASTNFSGLLQSSTTQPIVTQGVIGANASCRLSGVSITGNGQATQLMGDVLNGSATITFSSSISGVYVGNAVTDLSVYIQANTSVSGICSNTGSCTGATSSTCNTTTTTWCVVISKNAIGTNSSDSLIFWGPDAVDVLDGHVAIDGFSVLSHGRYNIDCGDENNSGGELQIKDTMLQNSTSDDVYIFGSCRNTRMIGDHVSGAGKPAGTAQTARGIVFEGVDLTLADGVIDSSEGIGLDLEGAQQVSVTGMTIASNGQGSSGGKGIVINGSNTISICGNHFNANDTKAPSTSAHIYFDGTLGPSTGVSFCGNSYLTNNATPALPQYVYDASSSAALASASFYENPPVQGLGVVSPAAALTTGMLPGVIPQNQVLPAPRAFITGLGLSNGNSSTAVNIAPGSATDNTGVAVITIPSTPSFCTVDTSNPNGPNGLDTGTVAINTTYFFFVIADLAPKHTAAMGEKTPSCIASASLTPHFTGWASPNVDYGVGVYHLVGALYTDGSGHWVSFQQDVDTFYLDTPVADVNNKSIGTTAGTIALPSVPKGISVEALGRCIASYSSGTIPYVLMFTPTSTPGTPANFPTIPGYAMKAQSSITSSGLSSFPYHLYTDTSTNIEAQSSQSSTTLNCMTDGWVWHRQQ